jgi:hypothetical protein
VMTAATDRNHRRQVAARGHGVPGALPLHVRLGGVLGT